jgi:Uma2 family endonuclease
MDNCERQRRKNTMTTTTQRLTLEEYITYNNGIDATYELVNGELILMSLGTGKHGAICKFLERIFDTESNRLQKPWIALKMIVGLQSPRAERWDTVRIPDIILINRDQWSNLQNCEAIIRLNESPPLLVVEVVSESTKNTDYRAKRSEYSVLDIPEYWIVDPLTSKVTILTLADGWYDAVEFVENDVIISSIFPEIQLTAMQILQSEI